MGTDIHGFYQRRPKTPRRSEYRVTPRWRSDEYVCNDYHVNVDVLGLGSNTDDWHSDAIVITSDSWWIYDIEQVSEGIRFSTRRVGNDRLAKNYSLGNLKRCFGAVFDETNFRTDLNSPELTEFLKDARAVYYHNRQNR